MVSFGSLSFSHYSRYRIRRNTDQGLHKPGKWLTHQIDHRIRDVHDSTANRVCGYSMPLVNDSILPEIQQKHIVFHTVPPILFFVFYYNMEMLKKLSRGSNVGSAKSYHSVLSSQINRKICEDKKCLEKAKKRLSDSNVIIKRLYEDSVPGNLSMKWYHKISTDYMDEQETL